MDTFSTQKAILTAIMVVASLSTPLICGQTCPDPGNLPPDREVMFDVTWGDDSGSKSESYNLLITNAEPAQMPNSTPGRLTTKPLALRRDKSYALTMSHVSTNLRDGEGNPLPPDYDYTLKIDGQGGSKVTVLDKGAGGKWLIYDEDQIGGVHTESREFYAAGKKLHLLPVELVELAPKLRDESDAEIVGSEKPAVAPKSTEMVERDPSATPTPLNDASAIRISWRDMKVKIGAPMTGKKVTWSMAPQFTPLQSDGTPEAAPRFRGKWGTAANTVHRHRFSASEKYGVNGYESIAQILETETSANVTTIAQTTVDADGYTAIRVNLPPVGFNKALIKISIEDVEGEIDLIELEVPAVIVIDPGHGGVLPESTADKVAAGYTRSPNGTWTLGGSSVNNATSYGSPTTEPISDNRTKTEEKDLTLNLGLQLRKRLESIRTNQNLKMRVIMTRTENINSSLNSRSKKSKEHGADIFYSIHFNGYEPSTVRGSEAWIEPSDPRPGSSGHVNENHAQDSAFATRMLDAMVNSIPGGIRRGGGPKEWWNPPTNTIIPTDTYADRSDRLGNEGVSPKSRACLGEVEFITNPDVENHLISGAAAEANQETLVNAFADAVILDFKIQE